jgi:acyl-CoA dehydrogenase
MDHLSWPFFEERHCIFSQKLDLFAAGPALAAIDHHDVDSACRKLVAALGEAGLLAAAVPHGAPIDSREICLARETLAWHDGLADFAFAMQGLGTGAISLAGSGDLRDAILPKVRGGSWLAAFALSEADAGSDVAAMRCAARRDGEFYVIDGEKTWISNGGIADVYTLFARTGEAPGTRGISAFVVFADDPGFSIAERIEVMAASAGHLALRKLPDPRRSPAREPGRRLQDRDAHARHLPRLGRRRGTGLRAARAR